MPQRAHNPQLNYDAQHYGCGHSRAEAGREAQAVRIMQSPVQVGHRHPYCALREIDDAGALTDKNEAEGDGDVEGTHSDPEDRVVEDC